MKTKTQTKVRFYHTQKRINKLRNRKAQILLSALALSALVIGWNQKMTDQTITKMINPAMAQTITIKEKEKDIITYFFDEAEKEGLTKGEIVRLLETIRKESNFEQYAIGYNAKSKSFDLGYWQINTKFHPEVSRECSFDLICSTKQAIRIYKLKGINEWSSNK
ncbi:MAG: hypothetical protein WC549_04605 [Actinomycetota bacterium]